MTELEQAACQLVKEQRILIDELKKLTEAQREYIIILKDELAHYHSEEERAKTDPFNLVKEGLCKENEGHIE